MLYRTWIRWVCDVAVQTVVVLYGPMVLLYKTGGTVRTYSVTVQTVMVLYRAVMVLYKTGGTVRTYSVAVHDLLQCIVGFALRGHRLGYRLG